MFEMLGKPTKPFTKVSTSNSWSCKFSPTTGKAKMVETRSHYWENLEVQVKENNIYLKNPIRCSEWFEAAHEKDKKDTDNFLVTV
jgi:hypothetical protein